MIINCCNVKFYELLVPICLVVGTVGILSTVVCACSAVYNAAVTIISRIAKFEFDKPERENGFRSAVNDLTSQIHYQPIQFTIAGFYVITKSFVASVKLNDARQCCSHRL